MGADSNSFKNTILGYQALSQGDANENNVVIGSDACKDVDNVRKFANNVFLGSSVGTSANLSINSVTIGPNAMSQGTGGEFNIVLGQGCGTVLGNDKVYTALTDENMVQGQQSVIIDLPFGSASYYFERDDIILIDDGNNNDKFEGVLSNVSSEYEGSKTRLTFQAPLTDNVTIEQNARVFVEMRLDTSNVGFLDTSKASANTFMGNDSAIANTIGSKNIAIGEQAFSTNKVGKYNNILGSQAGSSIISDHNTCFGTKAGNAIDTYSVDYQNTDYTFHSSNNAITTYNETLTFDNLIQSSVIDITGSTSNDGRYKVATSNTNVIKVEGIPNIKEDGVPEFINNESYFVDDSTFLYTSESLTTQDIEFNEFLIDVPGPGGVVNQALVFGIKFTNNSDYLKFKDAKKIKVSGTNFNDGIFLIDESNDTHQVIYRTSPDLFNMYIETVTSDVTITAQSISAGGSVVAFNSEKFSKTAISVHHFTNNHVFYNFFKEDRTAFRSDKDEYKHKLLADPTHIFVSNSNFSSEQITDIVFSEGKAYHTTDVSNYIPGSANTISIPDPNHYKVKFINSIVTISKLLNKITINVGSDMNPGFIYSKNTVKISDTTYNDGIYLVESAYTDNQKAGGRSIILEISATTPIVSDETGNLITVEQHAITDPVNDLNFPSINNLLTKGDIINFNMVDRVLLPFNYIYGSYLVDYTTSNNLELNDAIYLENIKSNDTKPYGEITLNKEIYSVLDYDTAVQYSHHNNFMYFQNKEITTSCNVVVNSSSNAYIQSSIDYAFVDFVPPVMVKLTDDSNSDNNGYYLIRKNEYPYTVMYLDRSQNFDTTSTESQVTIKSHSVSTTEPFKDLSTLLPGVEYKIFGSNQNHLNNIKPVASNYNGKSGIHKQSVYLDESLPVNDDIECKNKFGIYAFNSSGGFSPFRSTFINNGTSSSMSTNSGRFISFTNDNLDIEIWSSNSTVKMHVPVDINDFNNYDLISLDDGMTPGGSYFQVLNSGSTYDHKMFKVTRGNGNYLKPYVIINGVECRTYYFNNCTSNVGTLFPSDFSGSATIRVNEFKFSGEDGTTPEIENFDAYSLGFYGRMGKFLTFNEVTSVGSGSTTSSIINMHHAYNNSLTFETFVDESLLSWASSNISIPLKDPCPNISHVGPTSNVSNTNFLISFGEPNPSFRDPDNKRKFRGTANLYAPNTLSINSNITGRINVYASNNTVQLKDMIIDTNTTNQILFDYKKHSDFYTQGLFDTTDFSYLRPGQIITLGGNNGSSRFKIESIEDDDDDSSIKNTKLILEGINNSKVTNDSQIISNSGLSSISISRQYCLVSDRIDFSNFDPNYGGMASSGNYSQLAIIQDNLIAANAKAVSNTEKNNLFNFLPSEIDLNKTSNVSTDITTVISTDGRLSASLGTEKSILSDSNHIVLIPTSNIGTSQISNIYFNNNAVRDTFRFYGSNSTIISTTNSLTGFGKNEYIRIEDSSNSTINGFYLTHATEDIETNKLVLQNTDGWADGGSEPTTLTAYINTNTINSSDTSSTDLSVFKPGQKLIVSGTDSNNKTFVVSSNTTTSVQSIYCNIDTGSPHTANVTIEDPDYCRLISSMFIDETSSLTTGASDIEFHNSNSTIKVSDESSNKLLHNLRKGQTITVSGTNDNNGTITIDENTIPKDSGMTVSSVTDNATDALGVNATLTKTINIKTIGEPIRSVVSTDQFTSSATNFHYQDAEGNNLMLGSFAGQYAGAKSYCIHNVFIGSKVGQTNHGSGNILLGNETDLAKNEDAGATTYNNKFAVYKTNFTGVPSNPLLGGDFAAGVLGVNTIDPVSLFTGTNDITVKINETKTKMVVNGGAIAKSFSSFTGTHKILLDDGVSSIKPGMIVVSTGKVRKDDMIDTVVTVNTSNIALNKAVYGIYSHFEENMATNGEQEKIIDSNGNIVDNPNYQFKKVKTHYSASLGEGCILVTNVNGNIENGDYITTSNIAGYGMKQDDDILHNYTVAKCTEDVDWSDSSDIQYQLVGCTYHCG